MFLHMLYKKSNENVHVRSSVAQTVCALDSGPGGTGSISDRITHNNLWPVANFTLPRHRYGVNREPDVKFKFEFRKGNKL